LKDAVGYDESRGDSVNVVNASFTQEAPPVNDGELLKPKFWETPLFLDIAKIAGGLIVLLVLVLSVIRPLVRSLFPPPSKAMSVQVLPKGNEPEAQQAAGAAQEALPNPAEAAAINHEQQIAQARTLVTQDPKRVAQVVRGWVAQDD
jgi:flagellar M-ring protein FliF